MNKLLPGISLLLSVFWISCSGHSKNTETNNDKPIPVTVSQTGAGDAGFLLASGQVEAAQTANISTRLMGRITKVYVSAGDPVQQGQLLVTISDEDIQAKRAQTEAMISEAEAALVNAKKDYDRFKVLYQQQSATARELDNMQLQYSSAQSRVESARQMRNEVNAMMAYARLTAPFSGVVSQKLAETGSIANPGMTLLTVENNSGLRISASVAESDIRRIKEGDEAIVTVKSTATQFSTKIAQLNPSSRFTGGQYTVKLNIPDSLKKTIYAGMFVNVKIPLAKDAAPAADPVMLVPESALVHHDDLTGVYVVSNRGTALLRWIRTGKKSGDAVEVLSGLAKNESIITHADGKLWNGAAVTVSAGN